MKHIKINRALKTYLISCSECGCLPSKVRQFNISFTMVAKVGLKKLIKCRNPN